MSLQELKSKVAPKKAKRVGRGNASGHGTYSTRGMKGQSARTGGRRRPGFEGGQTPFLRRMPKLKGFRNPNYTDYQILNISDLNKLDDGSKLTLEDLYNKKMISKKNKPVKLLGSGDLEKKVEIEVHKASKSAIEKIEAKKGNVKLLISADKEVKKETAKEEVAE